MPVSLEKTSDSATENVESVEIALAIVLLTGAGLMLKLAVGRQPGPNHRNRLGGEPWSSSCRGCHRKDPGLWNELDGITEAVVEATWRKAITEAATTNPADSNSRGANILDAQAISILERYCTDF